MSARQRVADQDAAPALSCPACGHRAHERLESIDLDEQHRHYAPDDGARQAALSAIARRVTRAYSMLRCRACALEWADPLRAPDHDWYGLAYSTLNLYPGARWEFDFVRDACGSGDRVFDLGCGSGAFIKLCTQQGIRCAGADFAGDPVRRCREQGLDVRLIDLESGPESLPQQDATVVTAFQVLEHLAAPGTLFDLARAVSTDAAALWIAIPSHRRPSRIFGERDPLDQPPHHLTRWNEAALRSIGKRHGWTLDVMHYEPLPTAAALWWIATRSQHYRRATARRAVDERLARWAQYPAAWVSRRTRYADMTGFSMLGRFRKQLAQSPC